MKSLTLLVLATFCRLLVAGAEPTAAERATKRLTEFTRGESAGVAVLVARDGHTVFQGGFGFADIEHKVPITPETKFRIGSVTKQFTAAAILRLADERKLALTDPLAKFFPEFPRGSEITLHHLLSHTSGIRSYTDKPGFLAGVTHPITPAALIASFQNDPPDFAPGSNFRYNNSAYFLAGEIVGKVAAQPLAEYLRGQFFAPLGMKDTGIYVNSAPPPGMARSYSFSEGKLAPALDWDMSWAGGAGALYSTIGDLFRWNEALYGGRVISDAALKMQTTPQKLPEGAEGLRYGYGLVASEHRRLPLLSHGGGLHGWSSDLLWFPEQRCTIAVLGNALPPSPNLEPARLARALADLFLDDDIKKLPPLTADESVDPKTYAAFAGRYDYQGVVLTVTVESDHLYAQLTGQPKFEIFPKAANAFFWKVADAQVVFLRNEQGRVIAAHHTQNGGTFRAPKLDETAAIKLTAEQLNAVLGQYQYGLGAVLTVTRDGDQLFAQLTGQPKCPIFARSAEEFEWRVVPAQVRFVAGEDGKIAKAIHQQNGTTLEAPKIK